MANMRTVTIGRQSAGFVNRGHPWVRKDRFTKGIEHCAIGEAITLVDERGKGVASALANPGADRCALVYHRAAGKAFNPSASVERAWQARAGLHRDSNTNCYRIIHGEADFLPGFRLERYGQSYVLLIRNKAALAHSKAVANTIADLIPNGRLYIREQLDDLRKQKTATYAHDGQTVDSHASHIARELGTDISVQPCLDLATGIYVDQRGTRSWLRQHCAGKSLLNCFAYTGVFSSSLLVAGAERAIDLDLSGAALAVAEANAAHNKVSERHQAVKADCGQWLAQCTEQFDIIVMDPPTAARGGDGWVLRRDYPKLLKLLPPLLSPKGIVISCCNTLGGKPFDLKRALNEAGLQIQSDKPQLAADIPQKSGFPEGRPFRLEHACHA